MDFLDLVKRRESCRNFTSQPVEKEKLQYCLEAARLSPSACNGQPWRFITITNPELVTAIAATTHEVGMNHFTNQVPVFVAIVEEPTTLAARFGGRIKHHDYPQIDLGFTATHFCLAATSVGLSTCILGWFDEDKVKQLLSVPKEKRIHLLLAVGYGASDTPRSKVRKRPEDVYQFKE